MNDNNVNSGLNNVNDINQLNNDVNQTQTINQQVNSTIQELSMNQQINNNIVDNQNIVQNNNMDSIFSGNNIQNNNMDSIFSGNNIQNNINNLVDNNINQNVVVDNFNNNQVNNVNTQNTTNNVDEELVKVYVGEKYDKIKNSSFSIPTFFFGSLYLFYRKMNLYGWLMMLLGPFAFIGYIILAIKFKDVYIKDVTKKVNIIKLKNADKTYDELKNICSKKGGTSIGNVLLNTFGVFFLLTAILFILMLVFGASLAALFIGISNGNIEVDNPTNNNLNKIELSDNNTLIEDVNISGYYCMGSKCNISVEILNNTSDYVFEADNIELFKILNDYNDYVKVDIYYIENNEERSIVDYKVFIESTNEDISNIKSEEELRVKLGLYTLGEHTTLFTLKKIGMLGAGFNDDTSYSYITYTLIDDKNVEYEMDYINPDNTLNLVEGNKYNVTFEVVEGTFGYDFIIKEIK